VFLPVSTGTKTTKKRQSYNRKQCGTFYCSRCTVYRLWQFQSMSFIFFI